MAASQNESDDDETITGINVTPLVDVMLVLLVIFMVTANYMTHNAMGLQLPKAASGEDPGETNLNFTIDSGSRLFLDGKEIAFADVKPLIGAKATKGGNMQALITADAKTPHGTVIKLMDIIKKSGINAVAFNVEFDPNADTKL